MKQRLAMALAAVSVAAFLTGGSTLAEPTPTCSDVLDIRVHGQHIVGDYVAGIGHTELSWPPAGQVGAAVKANGGAKVPGGPGPGFHFGAGVAAGASFCLPQAQSPRFHFGR